jgi:hypothetical protein
VLQCWSRIRSRINYVELPRVPTLMFKSNKIINNCTKSNSYSLSPFKCSNQKIKYIQPSCSLSFILNTSACLKVRSEHWAASKWFSFAIGNQYNVNFFSNHNHVIYLTSKIPVMLHGPDEYNVTDFILTFSLPFVYFMCYSLSCHCPCKWTQPPHVAM